VTSAFSSCDPASEDGCLNHTYLAKAGYYWTWNLPGYGHITGTSYSSALVGDPTSGMILTVSSQPGVVGALGSCAMTMTIDGNRTYRFRGGWSAKLTWTSGKFVADLTYSCFTSRDDSGTGSV